MNGVIDQLRQAWDARTRREQRMLALMALLAAAVVLWLGVIRPAGNWRAEAAEDRARAASDLARVQIDLARLAPAAADRSATDAQGLEPVVRQTAEAAGLEITTGMDPSGRLGFRAANVPSAAVFGWLAALKTTHAIEPVSFSVTENADASLQVEGAF